MRGKTIASRAGAAFVGAAARRMGAGAVRFDPDAQEFSSPTPLKP